MTQGERDIYNNKRAEYMFNRRLKLRSEAINKYGAKCLFCGYSENPRALQFDHIRGGGSYKKGNKNATHYIDIVNAGPGEYQLLCANCNAIKIFENGEMDDVGRKNSIHMKNYWARVRAGVLPFRKKACSRPRHNPAIEFS